MLFVDEVRKAMPGDTSLDYIKHDIMTAARNGRHECTFDRPVKELDLENEIQWLKDQGFTVEVWKTRLSYNYYPDITVKW